MTLTLNAEFVTMAQSENTPCHEALFQLARRAAACYPQFASAELRLLCRSENATFLLTASGQRYALRLHRTDYHQRADIDSELHWLDALSASGIAVPQAIAGKNGQRVQSLKLPDGSVRHAVLFHWIEGEMPGTDVDPRAFQQLGEITARLHQHSRAWQRPQGFQRIVWDHHTMVGAQSHWGHWQDAPNLRREDREIVQQTILQVGEEMSEFGKDPQRYGLIHADLRLTNLLLHKGETRVIDFDDCGFGWYLHDLAAAISFVEHHPRAAEWIDRWIAGYERVGHISDEEMARIPALLIQRRIQLMAWAGSHADTEMARSLGAQWADHSVRLCRRYLERCALPVGA